MVDPVHGLVSLLILAAAGTPLLAQCATQWLPGAGLAGTDNTVQASILWDPDGPGPAPSLVVFAGRFSMAGDVPASRIAAYDLQSGAWSSFGSGLNGDVWDLAVLPNGNLVAAGSFTSAGGVSANRIRRPRGGRGLRRGRWRAGQRRGALERIGLGATGVGARWCAQVPAAPAER
jgi:hypothetical protein